MEILSLVPFTSTAFKINSCPWFREYYHCTNKWWHWGFIIACITQLTNARQCFKRVIMRYASPSVSFLIIIDCSMKVREIVHGNWWILIEEQIWQEDDLISHVNYLIHDHNIISFRYLTRIKNEEVVNIMHSKYLWLTFSPDNRCNMIITFEKTCNQSYLNDN